ncbi:cupin domain-containing protein [Umezawaea sp. Da 62-37]|uniref:cupin domain-containing protein n=1 Tax=Umezawaea sp. Da 62-37 TaxID=3075927 RepID=UPI0028F7166F|nr:cupin domain-containing protein [Umezawaea sp. Da 62-37]WNV85220.1 cupin domain-containing protein [Umezawaea sp. Da 62-37]
MTDVERATVQIHRLENERVARMYGLELKMLHPWPGLVTPFQGAWCVLRPGDVSMAHAHHDHEIFIVMAGRGRVVGDGQEHEISGGDIAFMRPGTTHHVLNHGDEDFSYYAIWWDRAMAGEFIARDRTPDSDEDAVQAEERV